MPQKKIPNKQKTPPEESVLIKEEFLKALARHGGWPLPSWASIQFLRGVTPIAPETGRVTLTTRK